MGEWNHTTYVRHGSVPEVARCLEAVFAREGMVSIEPPAPRSHGGLHEPMQYDDALHNDLWGVAVFPGAPGWTVVKTAPLELLGERRAGADRMRLAEACAALSASAVQVNVYDSIGILLVEVSPAGEVLLSGFPFLGDDLAWHSERLDPAELEPRFRIHPLGDVAEGRGASAARLARGLAGRLGGANAPSCDNLVSVDTLVRHRPLEVQGGAARYFRWTGPSRARPRQG